VPEAAARNPSSGHLRVQSLETAPCLDVGPRSSASLPPPSPSKESPREGANQRRRARSPRHWQPSIPSSPTSPSLADPPFVLLVSWPSSWTSSPSPSLSGSSPHREPPAAAAPVVIGVEPGDHLVLPRRPFDLGHGCASRLRPPVPARAPAAIAGEPAGVLAIWPAWPGCPLTRFDLVQRGLPAWKPGPPVSLLGSNKPQCKKFPSSILNSRKSQNC
jgi:hypothetical protein